MTLGVREEMSRDRQGAVVSPCESPLPHGRGSKDSQTLGVLTAHLLRSIVEEKWQSDPKAVAFGLHVSPNWKGPAEVECEFGKAHVLRADTVVQIREALLEAEAKDDRIILLTKLQQGDLGHDVVARMARSRLFPIDHVASLCGLFKAKELDRSICEPGIAHALLEYSPRDGYPPVSAGVLDAGTAWRAVCRHVFDMGDREPDLIALLLWATTPNGQKRFLEATEELQSSLRNRLFANLGDTANTILHFIDSEAGADALALAVACQVIFGKGTDEVLDAAAARLEQYHRNKPISKTIGRTLGNLASEVIVDLDRRTDDPRVAQAHLQRADELLKQFRCDQFAFRSDLTLESYEQRLARFGEQIKATVTQLTDDAIRKCEQLQEQLATHRLAKQARYAEQISRTKMAVRLVRWLKQPHPSSPTFSDMAAAYAKELAFVDWARESIVRGEDVPQLSAAYQLLDTAVAERHSQFSKDFAIGLADWCSSGSTNAKIIGVENVLEKVVAKVVESDNRVLLIVLDGMSWAVCHELLEDIRQDHWFEAMLEEGANAPPPVIATVPSETKYSRTSLLSGKLQIGDATSERRCFVEHPILVRCSDRRSPPVLLHKKDITQGSRGGVSDELSGIILSTTQRIVGVVINAIDDRLATAQQIRDDWTINRIIPLGALLRLARDSGRVVVLASDHGHVWHRADNEQEQSSEGSRWRPHDGKCVDGEIVVSGERVLPSESNGKVVVPWSEKIRYKRQQHGYHGGATPQEMICPLVILTDKSSAYSGLFPCTYAKPDWWSPAPVAAFANGAAPVRKRELSPRELSPLPNGRGSGKRLTRGLFDNLSEEKPKTQEPKKVAEKPKSSLWIERLLSSQAYRVQKEFVRRHAPEDDVVRRCLVALESQGGIMTPIAFSKAADVRVAGLDGLIAKMQRILNVDGYEILTFSRNENRVELNITKLLRQFDLDYTSRGRK